MKLFAKKPNTTPAAAFIYAYARNSKRSDRYKCKYRCIAKHLENFEKLRDVSIISNNFTAEMCEDFVFFLKEKRLAINTIRNYVSYISFMFRRMAKQGFDVNFGFEDVKIEREKTIAVYLTEKEIDSIYSLNFRDKNTEKIRDLFVIGCYTGLRFSDLSRLTNKNIADKKIICKTRKTGEVVVIPIKPVVAEILRKYDCFPPCDCSLFNFNKCLKTICKRAKINDKILIERTRGHRIDRFTMLKYTLVSSHTARRSFATNAYLSGVMPAKIMLITGHKSEQTFFEYIRIGKAENARELAEHPFFK